jgi:circadian clock protein KaiB
MTSTGRERGSELVVRLYVAGRAPNSVRAMRNLEAIVEEHDEMSWEVDVIDVLVEPLRTLTDGVLVTPTLIRVAPRPEVWIVGDLSREGEVLAALGVKGSRHEEQMESGE